MKKLPIFIILLLLFGFYSAFAQVTRPETTVGPQAAIPLEDPKLSPEEQALRLTAGDENPAKINEADMADSKINPENLPNEEDYGIGNTKPGEENAVDPKINPQQAQIGQPAVADPTDQSNSTPGQPVGEKGGTTPDYRAMQGGNEQPQGDKPENIPDYRKMQGSGQQPSGDLPDKK